MKTIALFLIVALACTAYAKQTDEEKAQYKTYYTECTTSTGVDKKLISEARQKKFTEDEKLMEYYKCMMHKTEIMSADGKLHPHIMKQKLPNDIDETKGGEAIDKCSEHAHSEPEAKVAYHMYKCFLEAMPGDVNFF